jgi:hypothetical protein
VEHTSAENSTKGNTTPIEGSRRRTGTLRTRHGASDTQKTTPHTGEKRKEQLKERLAHKHKNRKASKEVAIHALTKYDL